MKYKTFDNSFGQLTIRYYDCKFGECCFYKKYYIDGKLIKETYLYPDGFPKTTIEYNKMNGTISSIYFQTGFGEYYNERKNAPYRIWFNENMEIVREIFLVNGQRQDFYYD